MNRLQYRIVFNKQRGQLMAVAETAVSQTKGGSGESAAPARRALAAAEVVPAISRGPPALLALAAAFAMGAVITLAPEALAQVKADPNAPKQQQPTVVNSANGTVQVNIQTPSAAGVSRNTYSQFDVDRQGVILNNSRTDASTQLGGFVQGNPWLAKGSARVILNEVNSSAPSQLKGYVEVAGQRAEVIIANPAGIQVDGGGFINASAAVLTTGTPRFNADGSIAGYGVQGGLIRIDGQGLDGSQTDYTALLARAVELNAGLWAKDARIQTGTQVMTVEGAAAGNGAGEALTPNGERPRYALDSTALGGIYAQRITLVGTEAGLGVRQAGQIVGGQLTLRADGWLDNTGTVYAQEADANGTPSLTVQSNTGVRNAGWLASRGSVDLKAPQLSGEAGSATVAGMTSDGAIVAGAGSLSLTASQSATQLGQLLAGDGLAVQATTITADGARLASNGAALSIVADTFSGVGASLEQYGTGGLTLDARALMLTGATLLSNGALSARSAQLMLDGADVQALSISLKADGTLSQQRASLRSAGAATLSADRIDNRDARIAADGGVTLQAGTELRNDRGELNAAAGGIVIQGQADVVNTAGAIAARDGISVEARSLVQEQGGSIDGQDVTLKLQGALRQDANARLAAGNGLSVDAASIASDAQVRAGGALALSARDGAVLGGSIYGGNVSATSGGDLSVSGLLAAQRDLNASAARRLQTGAAATVAAGLGSDGRVGTQGALSMSAGSELLLRGQLLAADAAFDAAGIDLAGAQLQASNALRISTASDLVTEGARMSASSLTLQAQNWRHAGGQLAMSGTGDWNVALTGQLDNRQGQIQTNARSLTLTAQGVDNTGGRLSTSGDALTMTVQSLANQGGVLSTSGDLRVDARQLDNRDGELSGRGVDVRGQQVDNTGSGLIVASRDLSVRADALTNAGVIRAAGAASIDAGTLTHGGTVAAGGALDVHAGAIDSSGAFAAGLRADNTVGTAGDLSLKAEGALKHSGVTLAGGAARLEGAELQLQGSRTQAASVTAQAKAGDLRLDRAAMASVGALDLGATGAIVSENAQLSGGSVSLTAADWRNAGGELSQTDATGRLAATVTGALDNRGGRITANGTALTLSAQQLDNTAGHIVHAGTAAGELRIDAGTLAGARGEILGNGALTLSTSGAADLSQAQTQADRITVNAASLSLQNAQLVAKGAVDLTAAQALDNTSGLVQGGGPVTLQAATLTNRDGQIGGAAVTLRAGAIDNAGQGLVTSGSSLTVNADRLDNAGQLQAAGDVDLTARAALTNAGLITAKGDVRVDAGAFDHTGTVAASGSTRITAGTLTSSGSFAAGLQADNTVGDRGDLTITAQQLRQSGTSVAGGALTFSADSVALQGSKTQAGSVSLQALAGSLALDQATVAATRQLTLSASGALDTAGSTLSGGSVAIAAADWYNAGGTLAQTGAAGAMRVDVAGLIDNQGGRIGANAQSATLNAGQLDNRGGAITHAGADALTISAGSLSGADGRIASSGDLALTMTGAATLDRAQTQGRTITLDAGSLSHREGQLLSQGDASVRVSGVLDNSGSFYAQGAMTVTAGGALTHTGLIAAQGDLTVRADSIASSGAFAAGMKPDTTLAAQGELTLSAAHTLQHSGTAQAVGRATLEGASLLLQDSQTTAASIALNARGGELRLDRALLSVRDLLDLRSSGTLNTEGARMSGASVAITAVDWRNAGGQIGQTDAAGQFTATLSGVLDNQGGRIAGNGTALTLSADRIESGAGKIIHAGATGGTLRVDATTLNGVNGTIAGNGTLALNIAGDADLSGATAQGDRVTVHAANLKLRGGELLGQSSAALTVGGELDNTGGLVHGASSLTIDAGTLTNRDGQLGAVDVTLKGGTIDNAGLGLIAARGKLSADVASLSNAGSMQAGGDLDLRASDALRNSGTVRAQGDGTLNADTLVNTGTVAAQGALIAQARDIASSGAFAAGLNADNTLATRGDLALTASGQLQQSGTALAGGGLTMSGARLALQDSRVQAQRVTMTALAGDARLDRATVAGGERLTLSAANALDSSGATLGAGSVSITATDWRNAGGDLAQSAADGELRVSVAQALINQGGSIAANAADVTLAAVRIDNRQGTLLHAGTGTLTLSAQQLDGTGGEILGKGALAIQTPGALTLDGALTQARDITVNAGSLSHRDGKLLSQTGAAFTVGGAMDNTRGLIQASEDLRIVAASLDNTDGQLGGRAVSLSTAGRLLNGGQGLIASAQALTIEAGQLDNAGSLQSQAALELTAHGAFGNTGSAYARGPLTITADGALTNSGMLAAQGALSVQAASIASSGGFVAGLKPDNTLGTQGDLTLRTSGALQQSGQTVAAGAMTLSGSTLQLQDAKLQAQRADLTASTGDLRLNRATLASSGALTMSAAGAMDTGAASISGDTLSVTAQRWSNVDGVVTQTGQAGALSATLQGALDNTRGEIAAAGRTLTVNAGSIDNASGRLVHAGAEGLSLTTGTLSGASGEILGAHAVTLTATGAVDLSQAKTQGGTVTLQADSLRHQGGQLLSGGDAQLRVAGAIDNTGGAMGAGGDLRAQAASLDNTGGQLGARAVDLTLGTLTNGAQSLINAQTALTIGASQVTNAGSLQSGADTRLTTTGALSNSGNIYAQGNVMVNAGQTLTNNGLIGAQGALTVDAPALAGAGTLAAGLRPDNSLGAQGDLTVRTTGTLQSAGSMLAAGTMTLRGGDLQLQDSRLQAASVSMNSTGTSGLGALRLDRAIVAVAGDLMLASAGLLSTDAATLSGANVGITATTDWRNVGGSLTQTGAAGALTATIGNQLLNTDGRIQAAGTGLRLQAQSVDNVRGTLMAAGSGPLTVTTGSLDGSSGQILASGAVTIAATGAVTLASAQTQGTGVTVSGSSLDHRGGNLVSNGGALLNLTGGIDNRGGTVASAGALDVRGASLLNGGNGLMQSDSTLQATIGGTLDNQGGRLRSGAAMTLNAGNVDNRGGWAGSDGALSVTTGGALQNAGGTLLAQQGVSLSAATLGNQQGRISSLQGGVTLRAQGAIDNTAGAIQAGQTADLGSASMINARGEVSGAAVVIDARGQTLDNSGGRLLATQSLTVDSGTLENRGGLLQSGGGLSVQTHGAALNNTRDGSVTTPTGIRAQGAMTLNAGTLTNEQGISAGTSAQVNLSQLVNRAELSASALTVSVGGTLDNQGGRLIGAQTLDASAQQVLNQGGLIYGGSTLNLTAAGRIDNTNTGGAGQGIQGGAVNVRAQQLDNIGGQVLASGSLGLTIAQSLNNAGGALGASGTQTIGDGASVSALSLNNAGGRIWSGSAMGLNLRELAGGVGGQISSGAGMSVKLVGDFVYGASSQFQSAGDMVLDVSGNFANQGTLRSGGTLSISAQNIDNAASGELSGVNTLLTAAGKITNRGLIDGDGVLLTSDRLVNLGTGRIYGGDVVIDGGALVNGAEGGVAAVIAGRRSIDAQLTREISNTDGALIFADGDLRLAGASLLNENSTIEASRALALQMTGGIVNRTVLQGVGTGQGTGQGTLASAAFIRAGGDMTISGDTLLNSGATIEARSNLMLTANRIDNVNPYLMWGNYTPGSEGFVSIVYSINNGPIEDLAVPMNGRTAQEVVSDYARTHRTHRIVSWEAFGGNDAGAPLTQSLAAKIIVGGTLSIGAGTINNDMSQVVGMTGVAITGGQVTNVPHTVTAVDTQGVAHTVNLSLAGGAPVVGQVSQAPGGRQGAGAVSTGGGASPQQAQGGASANASGGAGTGGFLTRLIRQVQQGAAAQANAQGNAQVRVGSAIASNAVATGNGAAGAGVVQAIQRSGATATERAIAAAQSGDAGAQVEATLRHERDGDAVQTGSAQDLQGARVTTQFRDGQAIDAAQANSTTQQVQGTARTGLAGLLQRARAASAAQVDASAQTDQKATTQIGKVTTQAGSTSRPGSAQNAALRVSGLSVGGRLFGVMPNLTLPSNSLFKTHSEPGGKYLVETDPRFANYREWLSSDFLLQQMALDPTVTQKRLGDGFYEQRLVREQIGQLTGTGYLSGYADDESMYRALLTNGATFAKEHQLVPGVALSAEQMTQLTSDLVWLVEQTVTLADGTTQRVLVPQVYLVPREGDLLPSGSLIAGGRVEMALTGDFNNGGSVRGGAVAIQAQNIANTGDMRATTLALTAREDLRNIGGQLAATGDMSLVAGRDVVMQSTTASGGTVKGNVTTKATVLDQVASLTAGGVMVVQAGRDAQLQAVQITQGGAEGAGAEGGVMVAAGRDLTLSTVQTSSSRDQVWNATNFKKESQRQDVGTEIKAEGAVLLKAGQDLSATAAQIASAQGAVTLSAGRDVELLAGEANKVVEEMTQKTKKSLFKKKTVTTYNKTDTTTAIGTTLSGDTVNIVAGRDITLAAAQAVSDNGTKLIADRDITIDGVTNSVDTEQFKKTVKSGLFSGGGIGVTIGKQELSQATKTSQETHQGSVVASVAGDVDIYAGGKYRQVGSEVQAPQGDVTIKGKSIDIVEARNQSAQDTETKFRQSGLSLSLSAPGVDAAMGAIKAGEHVTQTQDDRMKALAAATAISKAKQAVEEIQKFNDLAKAQQEQSIRISLSVGSQQSKSSQHNEANQTAGSSVLADGKLSLIATGGGQDSNVTVRGSTLAGQDVFIKADNKIDLLAAQNTSEQHSKDSSSSASIGIGISLGQENRLGFTASASVSKGNADGKDTNYSATQVTGGSSVTLQSGGDTTLGGAVVTAPKVVADIGGNLKIESLQDTAKFDSKSQSMGGSVTVGYGAGGNANFSQSKVNADYAAVGEQAGIRAGDGGFQVSVKGNTELKGGAITSSQAAIDAGKNSFSTGTLTSSDIDNRSQFSASAVTVSAGTSGGMAGAFKDSGDERSTTRSTISAGSTTITSGDAASQATLEKLDRGATNDATAGKLSQGWDGQKLSQQVKVNAQIVAEFGAQASKEVAEQFKKQADKLRAEGKEQEAKKYEEGGEYRVAAHAVIGAMTGDLSGALGAAASAKVADQLNSLQETLRDRLDKAGLGGEDQKNDWATALSKLASGALATGLGAIAGGGFDGAAAGLNQDYNNRQLHPKERDKAAELAKRSKGKYTQEQIEDAMRNSGNSYYKEDVTAGMVIRDPKDPNAFYDKGAPFTTGDNGKSFVQINRDNTSLNSSNIDPDLAAFVRANTGGENSPYYDLAPKKITYPELAQGGKATGLQYQTVSANGQSFRLAIADCPAVSCQNTDNIARFGLSAEDKAQLDAYDAAVKKSLTKDAVKGGVAVAVIATAPATIPGAVIGGAVVGGTSSASDQYIDKGTIDGKQVAKEAVIGGVVGGGTAAVVSIGGVLVPKIGQALDEMVTAKIVSQSEMDAYVAAKTAQKISQNAERDGGVDPYVKPPNADAEIALRDKSALDAQNGTSNPHYLEKHGSYTSLTEQYNRAMYGINPQTGQIGRPVNASKYFNETDMEYAIKQAEATYAANPSSFPDRQIPINFGRPVGEGYMANSTANQTSGVAGEYRWTEVVVVGIDQATGKAYTSFPQLNSGVKMPDPRGVRP
ncbi:filamentous hemagglutinin [Mitsuaria sp. BK045]|uniref:two-partner secretion domain-containing protein n=1 Tax=unclassified Roseateles TaxID=2626991 RepID=UPI0016198CD1|nr:MULTISPECIES: hemagglutinin repeat-containing protein [unclassified Roseateles]MBB3293297.1 filamentous hemagglutinin [Mitsuaria sp. BK041]MBB3362514.1 filamentous hemagglutinin [Mitsuaria sp. BK045]